MFYVAINTIVRHQRYMQYSRCLKFKCNIFLTRKFHKAPLNTES